MANDIRLFFRIGDQADYLYANTLNGLAYNLRKQGVSAPLAAIPGNTMGVTCVGYEGNNYISIYWAYEAGEAICGLTTTQLRILNELMEKRAGADDDDRPLVPEMRVSLATWKKLSGILPTPPESGGGVSLCISANNPFRPSLWKLTDYHVVKSTVDSDASGSNARGGIVWLAPNVWHVPGASMVCSNTMSMRASCTTCDKMPFPGILWAVDNEEYAPGRRVVARCANCERYESDELAGVELLKLTGGTVGVQSDGDGGYHLYHVMDPSHPTEPGAVNPWKRKLTDSERWDMLAEFIDDIDNCQDGWTEAVANFRALREKHEEKPA